MFSVRCPSKLFIYDINYDNFQIITEVADIAIDIKRMNEATIVLRFMRRMGPIPWMLMAEIFPAETKAVASGLAVMLNWFLVFLVTKTFPAMNEGLGADVTFWIFATIMAVATGFTYFFVLETKGKTSQEIQEELQGNVRSNRTNA